jgi:hypothetical protein
MYEFMYLCMNLRCGKGIAFMTAWINLLIEGVLLSERDSRL